MTTLQGNLPRSWSTTMKVTNIIGLALLGVFAVGAAAAAAPAKPQVSEELVVNAPAPAHGVTEEIIVTAKMPERIEVALVDPADILAKDFSKVPGLVDKIELELELQVELSF